MTEQVVRILRSIEVRNHFITAGEGKRKQNGTVRPIIIAEAKAKAV